MKYCCQRFKEAIEYHEITKVNYPSGIEFFLCVVEGVESRVYYCPWCGKAI